MSTVGTSCRSKPSPDPPLPSCLETTDLLSLLFYQFSLPSSLCYDQNFLFRPVFKTPRGCQWFRSDPRTHVSAFYWDILQKQHFFPLFSCSFSQQTATFFADVLRVESSRENFWFGLESKLQIHPRWLWNNFLWWNKFIVRHSVYAVHGDIKTLFYTDKGTYYQWVDSTPLGFTNWSPGMNIAVSPGNCAFITNLHSTCNSTPSPYFLFFIETIGKHIHRL